MSTGGIINGYYVNINAGSFVVGDILINGQENVTPGGTAVATVVNSGSLESVWGITSGTVLNDGGMEIVNNYPVYGIGVANGTVVNNGGQQFVNGIANGTIVNNGGQQFVDQGSAFDTIVNNGGQQYVYGTSERAIVNSGGQEYVYGVAGDIIVNSGGQEYVYSGASATDTVLNGGTLIANGGFVAIAAASKGGTVVLDNGAVIIEGGRGTDVAFQFGGSGGLVLDVASAYTGKVSGFGDGGNTSQSIDLPAIAFNSNVHRSYSGNTTSGVLTVTSGTTTVAKINMIGNYTTANFNLSADSSGHVQITDPPHSASNTASSGTVTSGGSNGASFLDNASTFSGTLAGLWAHDHTGLPGIGFGAHTMLGHSEDGGDANGAKLALLVRVLSPQPTATAALSLRRRRKRRTS